jgi:hypothetical protein
MPQLEYQRLAESGGLRSQYEHVSDNGNRHGVEWLSARYANGFQHRHRNDHGHGYYGQHWHRNDDEPAAHHDATLESAAASLDTRKR